MQYRSIPALVALLYCLQSSTAAHAALITAVVTGADWSDIERGSNLSLLDNDELSGNDILLWGGDVAAEAKSGYQFIANAAAASAVTQALDTHQVVIGQFLHINQTVAAGSSIRRTTLNLTIDLRLNGTLLGELPFSIQFRHTETTNDCDTNPACASDRVVIESVSAPAQLAGLAVDAGFFVNGASVRRFNTAEDTINQAVLLVSIDPSSVAEPATVALLGVGVLGLALVRRHARNVQKQDEDDYALIDSQLAGTQPEAVLDPFVTLSTTSASNGSMPFN